MITMFFALTMELLQDYCRIIHPYNKLKANFNFKSTDNKKPLFRE